MSRRGQAALEFLTTYGWAFLIILVMIGAISYFGISNPSKLLPSRCITGSELSCQDYQILEKNPTNPSVNFILKQGVGKTIYLQQLTCEYEGRTPQVVQYGAASWSPTERKTFMCLNTSSYQNLFAGLAGQKVKVTYEVLYSQSQSGFNHSVSGEIYAGVQ